MQFLHRYLQLRIKAGTALLFVLYVLSMLYLVWELYWYQVVGWDFVKWHSHLAPYCFLLLLIFTLAWLRNNFSNPLLAVASVVMSLLFVEIFLLIKIGDQAANFVNQFRYDPQNPYHIWEPFKSYELSSPGEFSYKQTANSLGYFGKEWVERKDSGVVRILTLGDSFTEGFGTTTDSSYPSRLQELLGERYEVLNAGACGSDPVFNFKNLSDRLLRYQPDWVIQTVSSHDMMHDFAIRGGFERFKQSGTISWPIPAWVAVVQLSHIASLIADQFGINEHTPLGHIDVRNIRLQTIEEQLLARYDSLATAHTIQVLFVLLPMRSEVVSQKYEYNMEALKKRLSNTHNIRKLDLKTCYEAKLAARHQYHSSYYWKQDAHHNAMGYQMMADCIADELRNLIVESGE